MMSTEPVKHRMMNEVISVVSRKVCHTLTSSRSAETLHGPGFIDNVLRTGARMHDSGAEQSSCRYSSRGNATTPTSKEGGNGTNASDMSHNERRVRLLNN